MKDRMLNVDCVSRNRVRVHCVSSFVGHHEHVSSSFGYQTNRYHLVRARQKKKKNDTCSASLGSNWSWSYTYKVQSNNVTRFDWSTQLRLLNVYRRILVKVGRWTKKLWSMWRTPWQRWWLRNDRCTPDVISMQNDVSNRMNKRISIAGRMNFMFVLHSLDSLRCSLSFVRTFCCRLIRSSF